jgi:dihydropyrimidinase/allantoinase
VAQLYYGADFSGRITRTIVAGQTVYDGAVRGRPGWGQYVSPDNLHPAQSTRLRA